MKPVKTLHFTWPFVILMSLAFLLNVTLVSGFLLTLFMGWMIAEIMMPLHHRLVKSGKLHRKVAALLITLGATFAIILPFFSVTAFTIQKVAVLVEKHVLPNGQPNEALYHKAWGYSVTRKFFDSEQEFKNWTIKRSEEFNKKIPAFFSKALVSIPGLALQLIFALLTCYFVIVDGKRFSKWIGPKIPLDENIRSHLAFNLREIAVSSVLATFAAALTQATTLFIAFVSLGLPVATLAFGVSFLLAWIPLIGVGPVWISATAYLFVTNEPLKAGIMMAVGIFSSLIDNVVRSWILKDKCDLHPLLSLLVVFGNIQFFGILGVFTGPVLAKLLIECLEIWGDAKKRRIGFQESTPATSELAQPLLRERYKENRYNEYFDRNQK